MKAQATAVLDRLLTPVSECLTPSVARKLVQLRADEQLQARVDELAEKCNAGTLTLAERQEYETYVNTSTIIAILQAKARTFLARRQAAS